MNARVCGLLAAALLLGGWRDPRLLAAGGAAIAFLLWRERPPVGPASVWLPWLGWATLAALAGEQPAAALPWLARWLAVLGFFALAARSEREERRRWLATLLASCVTLAAAALWTGWANKAQFKNAMTGLLPPYYNYTMFALSAAAAAALAFAAHPGARGDGRRWGALGAAALFVACVLLAHSRAGLLGLAAGSAVWALRRWGWRAAAGGAVLAALALPALAPRLSKSGRERGEARPLIWRSARALASDSPWLGAGPGGAGPAFRRRPAVSERGAARWGLHTDYAHSEPLQAAVETGWAGLALWLAALLGALRALWGRASEEPEREAAAAAAAAMGVQLLIDNMLQLPGLALLFFSALAALRSGGGTLRPWPRAGAAAAGLLAAVCWVPRALAGREPALAARLFPAEDGPRADLAYRALAAGRRAEAGELFAEAERRSPFDAIYPWRRGQLAGQAGHWAGAEEHAARALALEPDFLRARALRAEALRRLGRRDEARAELAELRRRLALGPRGQAISGYERAIIAFEPPDDAALAALEAELRPQ